MGDVWVRRGVAGMNNRWREFGGWLGYWVMVGQSRRELLVIVVGEWDGGVVVCLCWQIFTIMTILDVLSRDGVWVWGRCVFHSIFVVIQNGG